MTEKGTIKWLSNRKPFGFIEQSNGTDIFFLLSEVVDSGTGKLLNGNRVAFDVTDGPKGLEAINIKKIN